LARFKLLAKQASGLGSKYLESNRELQDFTELFKKSHRPFIALFAGALPYIQCEISSYRFAGIPLPLRINNGQFVAPSDDFCLGRLRLGELKHDRLA
jgi:hypothetical protein